MKQLTHEQARALLYSGEDLREILSIGYAQDDPSIRNYILGQASLVSLRAARNGAASWVLCGNGDGGGKGDGDGVGDGEGNGNGGGEGDGDGVGDGDGLGDGEGDGHGEGYGDGLGDGEGNGTGDAKRNTQGYSPQDGSYLVKATQ